MTTPREIHPGRCYLVDRHCTQREFLLRPDDATNNAFTYCLIAAAQRAEVDILLSCVMSNHHHTIIFDRHGNLPVFTEHLHKLVAKSQNALRGRWENFWAAEPGCNVELFDPSDLLDRLVYVATNPVKDFLVDTVAHWPGVNTLADLLAGRALEAIRPRHFFAPDGDTPATLSLRQVIPPELVADLERFLAQLRERVTAVELACASRSPPPDVPPPSPPSRERPPRRSRRRGVRAPASVSNILTRPELRGSRVHGRWGWELAALRALNPGLVSPRTALTARC